MKKYLLIAFSLFTLSSIAQSSKDADLLINKISKRYKKFSSIKADFTYSIESKAEKINEKQKGNIVIKGNKFRLDIAGQTIICDNKTQWTYSKEINEVNSRELQINTSDLSKGLYMVEITSDTLIKQIKKLVIN